MRDGQERNIPLLGVVVATADVVLLLLVLLVVVKPEVVDEISADDEAVFLGDTGSPATARQ